MFTQFKKNYQKVQGEFKRGSIPLEGILFNVRNSKKLSRGKRKYPLTGFTLIELLVVLSIILVLTTISINGYLPFVTKIDYENVVLDVALSVRQYQLYGVGTKQNTGGVFDYGYGVHAEKDQNSIVFFEDKNDDKKYPGLTCIAASECLKKISMDGYKVTAIKTDIGDVSSIDITFKRPYLEATILEDSLSMDTNAARICIQPTATDSVSTYAKIVISRTGQVFVAPTDVNCS